MVYKTQLYFLLSLLLAACSTQGPTRGDVAKDMQERSGYALPGETKLGDITLPPGASLEDGITEDEAVMIALWNNAVFQETLVNVDMAHGDLVQAGLLPNPVGTYAFAVADKPLRYALELPLEALWLQPLRVNAAKAEAERVSHQVSQAGLNLIRDARRAYSDMLQAQAQAAMLKESQVLRSRIASLAEKRFKAGDISPQEVNVVNLDALNAEQNAARSQFDIRANEERLRFVMGVGAYTGALKLDPVATPECKPLEMRALVDEALKSRPDMLAAKEAIEAAKQRSHITDFGWLGVVGVADATSGQKTGHELGPAVRANIPVFNQNQGNMARADAEVERALRNEQTVAHQLRLDINQAYVQYGQACKELSLMQTKVKTGLQADLERVQKAYEGGNVPYVMVLEASRAVVDSRLRGAQLKADVRRATAELERSAGKKIAGLTQTE